MIRNLILTGKAEGLYVIYNHHAFHGERFRGSLYWKLLGCKVPFKGTA